MIIIIKEKREKRRKGGGKRAKRAKRAKRERERDRGITMKHDCGQQCSAAVLHLKVWRTRVGTHRGLKMKHVANDAKGGLAKGRN